MRLVLMGSPAFAVPTLDALVEARCELPLVVTQPDRRAGRGRRLEEIDRDEFREIAQRCGMDVPADEG